jgi:hypothetical protein
LPPSAANKVKIIFRRGVYLAENTSQAASVDFVPSGDKICAQQTAKISQKSPKDFFEVKRSVHLHAPF